MLQPQPVDELSDDDEHAAHAEQQGQLRDVDELSNDDDIAERAAAKRKPKKELTPQDRQAQIQRLRNVVSAKCRCSAGNCRKPFKENPALCHKLLEQRILIMELPKLEADRMVSWPTSFVIKSWATVLILAEGNPQ